MKAPPRRGSIASEPTALSPLPPLSQLIKPPDSPLVNRCKLQYTLDVIREVARHCRQADSIPFYSMRQFTDVLGVPLRTAAVAFERLEAEGILLRLRGSHTKLLGDTAKPLAQITSVVGLPENLFILRHYVWRRSFSRALGDTFRRNHIATDVIFHWEHEDDEMEFANRLLLHRPNIAVWFHPFRPQRQTVDLLKDNGIRSLVICDSEQRGVPAHIQIDWTQAYQRVLQAWSRKWKLTHLALVEGRPHSSTRLGRFEELATERGFRCQRFTHSPELASQLLSLPSKSGIVLLDEWAAIEFALRDPASFMRVSQNYRILFGREMPSIPFCQPGSLSLELLSYPVGALVQGVKQIVLQWQARQFDLPVLQLEGIASLEWTNKTWM